MVLGVGRFGRKGSFERIVVGFRFLVDSWGNVRFGELLCNWGHEW